MNMWIQGILVLCFVGFASGNGIFGAKSWLRPFKKTKSSTESKLQRFFQLRGGANEDETSEKVKGVCVGIDLGTTYR